MKYMRYSPLMAVLAAVASLTMAGLSAKADVMVFYGMTNVFGDPDFDDPVNTVDGDVFSIGFGVGSFTYPYGTGGYASSPVASAGPTEPLPIDAVDGLAKDCLFYFNFTVGSAVTNLDLSAITFDIARGGGNTNRGFAVFVTTPTTTDEQVYPSTPIPTMRATWTPYYIDLSGVASLQGLSSGQYVTVKIPFWTASTGNTIDLDSIAVHGIANHTTNEPPVLPLKIANANVQPDSVTITWDSDTNRVYAAEYSVDLVNWTEFASGIPGDPAGSTSATLDTSPGGPVELIQYQMGANVFVVVTNVVEGTNVVVTNSYSAPQIQDPANLASGSVLTPGAGLNNWNVDQVGLGYDSTPVLLLNFLVAGTDLPTAILNTNWFSFDLTVGSNVTDLDLTSLEFNAARGGGATPRGYGVCVTTPTTTDEEVRGATDVQTVRPTWDPQNVELLSVASLQNLTAGQVVTFTIPCYSPATGSSLEFDDITVKGNVTPPLVNPPPYVGAPFLYFRVGQR
jgi:hypothetical protein